MITTSKMITTHKIRFRNIRLNSKNINLLVNTCYFKTNRKIQITHSNNLVKALYRPILCVKENYLMTKNK